MQIKFNFSSSLNTAYLLMQIVRIVQHVSHIIASLRVILQEQFE
jgi:hypothetical protein